MKGFTLTELLTVVAILGIITVVGIPAYQGHKSNASDNIAKNNIRSIYMQQQEYLLNNNIYYSTGDTCTDSATAINTNLFEGKTILPPTADGFRYCILQTATSDFTARAEHTSVATTIFTVDENNVANF